MTWANFQKLTFPSNSNSFFRYWDFVAQQDIYRYEKEENKTSQYPTHQSTVPAVNGDVEVGAYHKI